MNILYFGVYLIICLVGIVILGLKLRQIREEKIPGFSIELVANIYAGVMFVLIFFGGYLILSSPPDSFWDTPSPSIPRGEF